MSNSLNRTLERVRQNRAQLAREDDAARARTSTSTRRADAPLAAGDIAYDRVSGEHVEVVGGRTENVVVPALERRDG